MLNIRTREWRKLADRMGFYFDWESSGEALWYATSYHIAENEIRRVDVNTGDDELQYSLGVGGVATIDADSGTTAFVRFTDPGPVFYTTFLHTRAGEEIPVDHGYGPQISPDGRYLAYVSPVCPGSVDAVGLRIVSIDHTDDPVTLVEGLSSFWWLADGDLLLRVRGGIDQEMQFYVTTPPGDQLIRDVFAIGTDLSPQAFRSISPDLGSVISVEGEESLALHSLITGSDWSFPYRRGGPIAWSPDSLHFAYWTEGNIVVAGLDGSSWSLDAVRTLEIAADRIASVYPTIAWAPDNETLALSFPTLGGRGVCD